MISLQYVRGGGVKQTWRITLTLYAHQPPVAAGGGGDGGLVRANKVTAVQLTLLDFIKVRRRLSAVFMPSKQFFLRTVEDVSSRET